MPLSYRSGSGSTVGGLVDGRVCAYLELVEDGKGFPEEGAFQWLFHVWEKISSLSVDVRAPAPLPPPPTHTLLSKCQEI